MPRAYSIPTSALKSSSDWKSALATSAGLGFDTLCLALSSGDIFATAVSADLDLAKLVGLAGERSLQIILDFRIASVLASSPMAQKLGLSRSDMGARDPRVSLAERQNLPIPFSDEAKARTWIDALRTRLLELQQLGVAGFCCRPTPDTPDWVFPLLTEGAKDEGSNAKISLWASVARLDALPKFEGFAGVFLPASNLFEPGRPARVAGASRVFGEIVFSPAVERLTVQGDDPTALQKRSKFLMWASAALGDGILVPMGFEYGLEERIAHPVGAAKRWSEFAAERSFDLSEDIAAANAFVASESGQFDSSTPLWPLGADKVLASVRRSDDKTRIRVVLANPAMDRDVSFPASSVSREVGEFLPLKDVVRPGPNLAPDETLTLKAGEVRILEGRHAAVIRSSEVRAPPDDAVSAPRIVIEGVTPCVDGGRHSVKRIVGDAVISNATLTARGTIRSRLRFVGGFRRNLLAREADDAAGQRPMGSRPASRTCRALPVHVEAWRDEFAIYRSELRKKYEAGVPVALELREGEACSLMLLLTPA